LAQSTQQIQQLAKGRQLQPSTTTHNGAELIPVIFPQEFRGKPSNQLLVADPAATIGTLATAANL
jgi:hypothetical protein